MLSILVVEDDPNIARLMQIYLQKTYEVRCVDTAQGAIDALAEKTYRVVVLDLTLPDRSGWDLLPTIKTQYPDIQVLITTGDARTDIRERADSLGAAQLLIKPITPAQVQQAIEGLL